MELMGELSLKQTTFGQSTNFAHEIGNATMCHKKSHQIEMPHFFVPLSSGGGRVRGK